MRFFKRKKTQAYTIIIGCGRLGASLASTLSNEGENVMIIDENKDSFRRLATNYGGLSLIGNGTDFDVLKMAEIERASAVVAVTNDDNTNIMIAQIARDVFGVLRVIARLYDPESETVYQKFGIDTICPSVLSAKEIDKLLGNHAACANTSAAEDSNDSANTSAAEDSNDSANTSAAEDSNDSANTSAAEDSDIPVMDNDSEEVSS